jgi:hypothetical protein
VWPNGLKEAKKTGALEDETTVFEGPGAKPLNYFEQMAKVPETAGKFALRLPIVKSTVKYGVQSTARVFNTTPKTVRK